MATNQLQATQGTERLILHRPEQVCNRLWIDSREGQKSKRLGNGCYSNPTALWRKEARGVTLLLWTAADGPHGAGPINPLHRGRRRHSIFPLTWTNCSSLMCFSGCPQRPARHLTKITSGSVCPTKKLVAGPNWAAGKHKTPNKKATGKGVYIPPLSMNRYNFIYFFLN